IRPPRSARVPLRRGARCRCLQRDPREHMQPPRPSATARRARRQPLLHAGAGKRGRSPPLASVATATPLIKSLIALAETTYRLEKRVYCWSHPIELDLSPLGEGTETLSATGCSRGLHADRDTDRVGGPDRGRAGGLWPARRSCESHRSYPRA